MRLMALGLCAIAAVALVSGAVSAAPVQRPDRSDNLGSSTPAAVNDHDGTFVPNMANDRYFEFNPDGEAAASAPGDADQDDEDGDDDAIYQGEDDILPA